MGRRDGEGKKGWELGSVEKKRAKVGSMNKEKVRIWNDWKEIERDKINFILNCRPFNL